MHDTALLLREKCGKEFFLKEKQSFVHINCPACASDKNQAVKFYKYGFSHIECPFCRTLYVSPRPGEDLLVKYYSQYEAPLYWTKILIETNEERKKLQQLPRVKRLKEIMDNNDNSGEVFADIGAGNGNFAAAVKEEGIFKKVIAADFSEDCIKVCKARGLEICTGTIDNFTDSSLDCITGNDLLEHLFNPHIFLETVYKKLKKNGIVMFSTPNGEGFDFKILKDKTENITPPEHIQYFNTVSIKALMQRSGFKVLEVSTPGMLDVEIIKKQFLVKNYDLSSDNEYIAYLLNLKNGEMETSFQEFISKNGLSSHMLIFAKKV